MIIDVHGHVTHPELFARYPMPPALADIEGMLERKAQAGIGLTIVGSPVGFGTMMRVPGVDNYAQPIDRLRAFHAWLAETVAAHPGRLAAYAYTNPFGGDGLLEATAETVAQGGFVGLIVNTSVRGEYLDSERADDFFAMAAELDRPILLHPPAEPVGSDRIADFRVVEQAVRFFEVATTLASLVLSGRLKRYPGLRLIASGAGGGISLVAGRLDAGFLARRGGPHGAGPAPEAADEELPSAQLRHVYVDTANLSVPNQLANLELMGPERMLFGTDSPPSATPLATAIELVKGLPIHAEARDQILAGNARRLFGL